MLSQVSRVPTSSNEVGKRSQETATLMPDPFVFVPIATSEAAKGRGATKRIVRAHVTRVQHAKSRKPNAHTKLQLWTVTPHTHREVSDPRHKRAGDLVKKECLRNLQDSERASNRPSSASSQSSSNTELVLAKLPAGNTAEDPFWTFPVDYQPHLSPIFAHYIQHLAVDIPDLDGPGNRGLLRKLWFPLCMTNAATMYAVLLMGAAHYCAVNPSKAAVYDLLALKARALREINAAMANPDGAVTDAMVGAVAKMAAYEAVFGDSSHFLQHMKGLRKMLDIRGGLATLGLDGLLERMLVWINLNASWLTGVQNVEFEAIPTAVVFVAPDPYHFAGIQ